ncbi:WH2 domain-containing protein [Cardinium endosymbiont of Sogatella furcifera]|uniref:WH2 domain-containing protein n=1 Tax=Cardinium endosymbiont of Sogatella furcifera TaxID=650378 RepID=UPI0013B46AE3|nr:WH2 domain-containing protein [Cardinium endosymbiont of Sogatella furcifera]
MDFCQGLPGNASRFQIGGEPYRPSVSKSNDLEVQNKKEAQGDDVKFVLGRGTVLNLGDELCGVFVTADTKEVFIVKLHSKEGWMKLIEHHPQVGKESEQKPIVRVRYDHIEDPRIIKVDHTLLERLLQQLDPSAALSASSSDKEDFWHKIQDNPSWREIAFCYKVPFVDRAIFKEDGITSEFTTELYKKYSYTTSSCINSKLSISGSIPSATLKSFEKVGFLLVKAQPSLVHLVKEMLACDSEWATQTAVAADYINCPAEFVGDLLQFDSKGVANDYSSLRLEAYPSAYCYLQEGEYYRLMTLDQVRFLMKTDREPHIYYEQVERLSDDTPIDEHEKEGAQSDKVPDGGEVPLHAEDQNDASRNEQQTHTHNPEAAPTQNARKVSVHTSPMQYTGSTSTSCKKSEFTTPLPPPPPPPPPTAPSSDLQCSGNNSNHTVHVASTPPQSLSENVRSSNTQTSQNGSGRQALLDAIKKGRQLRHVEVLEEEPTTQMEKSTPGMNSIPVPPPPPPPMPPSAGFVLQSVSEPNQGSGVKMDQRIQKDRPLQSSSGNPMMDELTSKLNKKASIQSSTISEPKRSPADQAVTPGGSQLLSTNGSIPPPPPMPPATGPVVNGIPAPPPPASTGNKQMQQSSTDRDALLEEIRTGGIKLKKVENDPSSGKKGKGHIESTNPLFASLHKAMEKRREALNPKNETVSDIDSGSEPEEDDNEWDD